MDLKVRLSSPDLLEIICSDQIFFDFISVVETVWKTQYYLRKTVLSKKQMHSSYLQEFLENSCEETLDFTELKSEIYCYC